MPQSLQFTVEHISSSTMFVYNSITQVITHWNTSSVSATERQNTKQRMWIEDLKGICLAVQLSESGYSTN